jgi:hypothetical protein
MCFSLNLHSTKFNQIIPFTSLAICRQHDWLQFFVTFTFAALQDGKGKSAGKASAIKASPSPS